jgi:hypothetical protein
MRLSVFERVLFFAFLLTIFSSNSWSQGLTGPLAFHKRYESSMPVAIYKDIKAEDLKKMIVTAFKESNFSLISINEAADQGTLYNFSYKIEFDGKIHTVNLVTRSNGNVNSQKRCANCFLRFTNFSDDSFAKNLPWMVQYELSSKVFPDLDKAYDKIKMNGQKYMDQQFGFDYKNQWQGERNSSSYGNAFIGIDISTLKREVIKAYTDAGFNLSQERSSGLNSLSIVFSFPIDNEEKREGVVYIVHFLNQFSSNEFCSPCEVTEAYNPYQKLPAAGILGIQNRLTLESRFSSSRERAFELLNNSTARYLRPRTTFLIPPKPAPLGSILPNRPPPPPPT